MGKNIIEEVAHQLGVELEEEFKVKYYSSAPAVDGSLYKFIESGLQQKLDGRWIRNDSMLQALLNGAYEIVKIPWAPKHGDKYYHLGFTIVKKLAVCVRMWEETEIDYALKNAGMIYRTSQECEKHLSEDYKRLTGRERVERNK